MAKYHIWTIGCQMNKAESERLASYFEGLGYEIADIPAEADLIVLNSCVVRQHAEDRVVNKLHALKTLKQANPNLTLAVTGCLVNADNARLKRRLKGWGGSRYCPGIPTPAATFPSSRGVTTSAPTASCPTAGGERRAARCQR
jgi:hypothetical protein